MQSDTEAPFASSEVERSSHGVSTSLDPNGFGLAYRVRP